MTRRKMVIYVLILIWVGVFVMSFVASMGIDGPRNIDTGFKRLDVLARYQMIAFAIAVSTAVLGFLWRKDAKRILLVGLVPVVCTVLLIVGLLVTSVIVNSRRPPPTTYPTPKPTAPAADQPAAVQD